MLASYTDRTFKLWEYWTSHGSMLIRSQKKSADDLTIDLIFQAVDYLEIPEILRGITIDSAQPTEHARLESILGKKIRLRDIHVLTTSSNNRHFVVAALFRISESKLEFFESPFDYDWIPPNRPKAAHDSEE